MRSAACGNFARRQVLCAGLFLAVTSTASLADQRCYQLEALNQQYAGVQLTSTQKQLKQKLVAWYRKNCGRTRNAVASR